MLSTASLTSWPTGTGLKAVNDNEFAKLKAENDNLRVELKVTNDNHISETTPLCGRR